MKKFVKKFTTILLSAVMAVSMMMPAAAQTTNDGYTFSEIGEKTAEALVKPGQYEITVGVPGAVETDKYSEVIVMVDASSSQGDNLEKLKAILVDIAEQVLHNDGSVRLTLMGFGMGPATVGSFYNAETLEAYLKDLTQADLRQGVSATNCEAALQHVKEYIESSNELNKTCVIFTSDGMTNMDEVTFNLCDWKANPDWYANNYSTAYMGGFALKCQVESLLNGGIISSAAAENFQEEAAAIEIAKAKYGVDSDEYAAAVNNLYTANIEDGDACIAFADDLITDAITNAGLDITKGYSTSDYEKVFLEYDNGAFFNFYLYTIFGITQDKAYSDHYNKATWGARAADAADALCENEKVLNLYMLDFASKQNSWMNPASTTGNQVTSDKVTYLASADYGQAVDKILELSNEMFTTLYNNATVTDPMSKWVDLDPSSIRIYEDDLVIWENGAWLYEDKQPAENPITLTGNAETGYTITWRIKDGALLYTDRYFLKYVVDVDETVEGFVYDTEYPANDRTYVTYEDENGNPQEEQIDVPDVSEPTIPSDLGENDLGMRIYKGSQVNNTPISDITFHVYKLPEDAAVGETPTEAEINTYAAENYLVASVTTNAVGYVAVNLTEAGEGIYLIVEEHNAAKVKEPVAPFFVSIPMPDPTTGELQKVVDIYPKNVPIPEEDTPVPPVIPEEPEDPTTGKVTILKHHADKETTVLKGAEFQIYRVANADETAVETVTINEEEIGLVPVMSDGNPITFTTGEDGMAASPELSFGLYFLVETKAPHGYKLLDEAVPVFVTSTSEDVKHIVKIANEPGFNLPETGGQGTYLFTVIGVVLMGAAVILVIKKKNNKASEN